MVEIFIPSYLESFKSLLENLNAMKFKGDQELGLEESHKSENLMGLAKRGEDNGE